MKAFLINQVYAVKAYKHTASKSSVDKFTEIIAKLIESHSGWKDQFQTTGYCPKVQSVKDQWQKLYRFYFSKWGFRDCKANISGLPSEEDMQSHEGIFTLGAYYLQLPS